LGTLPHVQAAAGSGVSWFCKTNSDGLEPALAVMTFSFFGAGCRNDWRRRSSFIAEAPIKGARQIGVEVLGDPCLIERKEGEELRIIDEAQRPDHGGVNLRVAGFNIRERLGVTESEDVFLDGVAALTIGVTSAELMPWDKPGVFVFVEGQVSCASLWASWNSTIPSGLRAVV